MVHFSESSSDFSNDPIGIVGTPNNFIAPLWDDLRFNTGSAFYDTIGSAPDRQFIIQWDNIDPFSAGSSTGTFSRPPEETTA